MKSSARQRLTQRLHTHVGAFGITLTLGLFGMAGLVQECAPPPPAVVQVTDVQAPVVASVNEQRAAWGIGGVVADSRLTNAAQSHANDMANRSMMTHTGSDGSSAGQRITLQGYGWSTWAENVAAGQSTPGDVVAAWLNSTGHRDNIANRDMANIGVAAAKGADGVTYWAMVLAAPR